MTAPLSFDELPPDVQRQLEKDLKLTRKAKRPKPSLEYSLPAFRDPAFSLAPDVEAWKFRRHPTCGWEGVGLCAYCGRETERGESDRALEEAPPDDQPE